MMNVRAEQMESCIAMEKGQCYLFASQSMAPEVEFFFSLHVKVTWTMQEQLVVRVNARLFRDNTFYGN